MGLGQALGLGQGVGGMSRSFPTASTDPGDSGAVRFNKVAAVGDALWRLGACPTIFADGSSTANSIVVYMPVSPVSLTLSAYEAGPEFVLVTSLDSTSAVQINIDGLGPIALKDQDGNVLSSSRKLTAGRMHRCKLVSSSEVRVLTGMDLSVAATIVADTVTFSFQKATSAASGGLTANVQQRVPYNTTLFNGRTDVSLDTSTGIITVGAGKWEVQAWQAFYSVNLARILLRKESDLSLVAGTAGQPVGLPSPVTGIASLEGVIDIASATALGVYAMGAYTNSTNGLGAAIGQSGVPEYYGAIKLRKVA